MNGLYEILNLQHHASEAKADIILNTSHAIFKGHYPGQPVLPGACMVQIVKDTLELALDRKLQLKDSTMMKFLSMVDPREINTLTLLLHIISGSDPVVVRGDLCTEGKTCFKFQGSFITV